MEVRAFHESDIDIVYEIQRAAYKPLYEKYHDDDLNPYMESKERVLQKYMRAGTQGYLFILDGKPVGAVRIAIFPETQSGKVSALAVLPQYQGQGIAQQALQRIEELHQEIKRWFLDTILQEKGNCHLYERLGYTRTGKIERINERMDIVYYEKNVADSR